MSAPLTPTGQTVLELLDHIDRLKAVHRASESPTFGQVEQLFDLADLVRQQLVTGRAKRAPWPKTNPAEQAARRLVELVMASLTEDEAGR